MGLDSLNELVDTSDKPTDLEMIYYLFWEKGIDLNSFNKLPLPYIFSILKVHSYIKEKEKEDTDKIKRKI